MASGFPPPSARDVPWSRTHPGSGRGPRAPVPRRHRRRAGGPAPRCRPRSAYPSRAAPPRRRSAAASRAPGPRRQRPSTAGSGTTRWTRSRTVQADRATACRSAAPTGWHSGSCDGPARDGPSAGAAAAGAAATVPTARRSTHLGCTPAATPQPLCTHALVGGFPGDTRRSWAAEPCRLGGQGGCRVP